MAIARETTWPSDIAHKSTCLTGPVLRWVGDGETCLVGEFALASPLAYICDSHASTVDEPSCILIGDGGRPAEPALSQPRLTARFRSLRAPQRAAYLAWMAAGRAAAAPTPFVVMYFGGLERRILIDNQDLESVLLEAGYLLHSQALVPLWQRRIAAFAAFVLSGAVGGSLSDVQLRRVLDRFAPFATQTLAAVAVHFYADLQEPLPAPWAWRILQLWDKAPSSSTFGGEATRERFLEALAAAQPDRLRDHDIRGVKKLRYFPANVSLIDAGQADPFVTLAPDAAGLVPLVRQLEAYVGPSGASPALARSHWLAGAHAAGIAVEQGQEGSPQVWPVLPVTGSLAVPIASAVPLQPGQQRWALYRNGTRDATLVTSTAPDAVFELGYLAVDRMYRSVVLAALQAPP